jgi:hypothetical protein
MTDISTHPLELAPRRFASWVRIVGVIVAVVALLALSFALGRATMSHVEHTTTIVRPVVVTPANPSAANPLPVCHLHGPC